MIVTKLALPRRTFLRGIGATLALPLLDAMRPALTASARTAARPVKRLGFAYLPMGAAPGQWSPAGEGAITELSPILNPLTPYLDRITVVSNLEHKNAYAAGNHATANCTFLSGVRAKFTDGSDYEMGVTADQIAARQLGRDTLLPSLELATDFNYVVGNCDNGYACVYMNTLSWSSPTSPLPTEADPRVVFERMFGDGGTASARKAELRQSGSILDWVLGDMARLQRTLGPADRTKVDQYLDAVREVERRIQRAERDSATDPTAAIERPIGAPQAWEDHVKLMFDLQVLAFAADVTRVITFQLAREVSTRTYPQIGVPEAHHPTSHHQNDPEKLAKLTKINTYHVSLFGYLLERLRNTADGDGSLLDNTMYLFGSGMGNPDVHDHSQLPILVAGGSLKGGRHLNYGQPTPLSNLLLTMLNRAGIESESFADSTGRVEELIEPLSL
ncbi:MAG TPA: DUF1552 domain-containing protein [Vicinamibacterales bacterium]|nr:DUF1552 domain-containing protein [Vicinamibacterales bacterium]